jgi:solute carrier family 7 (cationic amino acid transporter), member 3
LGAMFPLPRVLYAMSTDGMLYKTLEKVNPRTKTPIIATMLSGLLAAIMATMFNLHQLIDMMSIGTLLAYTIVAMCVLVLRYQDRHALQDEKPVSGQQVVKQIFNLNFSKYPTTLSSRITKIGIVVFSVISVIFCYILGNSDLISSDNIPVIVLLVACFAALILITLVIARQPADDLELSFKVPCVPIIPCLSVLVNIYLMLQLDIFTWIRFIVWMTIGYFIYFTYSIGHSTEGRRLAELNDKVKVGEPNGNTIVMNGNDVHLTFPDKYTRVTYD